MLAAIAAIVLIPNGFLFWMMAKIDSDLKDGLRESREHWIAANARIDASFTSIDAMGARIDATQAIIMRMLEKQGR